MTLRGKTLAFAERVGLREIDVSLTHSRTMAGAVCVAASTRAATVAALTARAALHGRGDACRRGAVPGLPRDRGRADGARRRGGRAARRCGRIRDARRFAVVCGGGANGGDGRIAARVLREAGREAVETDDPEGYDVVVDALFGTGFHGAPRPDAAALIERINACGAPVIAVDLPSGVDASTGEVAGAAVDRRADRHLPRRARSGSSSRPAGSTPGASSSPTSGSRLSRQRATRATDAILRAGAAPGARTTRSTRRARCSWSAARRDDRRGGAHRPRCASGRRRLRHARGAREVAGRRGDAGARAGQARLRLGRRARALASRTPSAADALAIGPGLGRGPEAQALVAALLERLDLPVVVDADALYGLEPLERAAPTVLTPACGELARLLGCRVERGSAGTGSRLLARGAERYGASCC